MASGSLRTLPGQFEDTVSEAEDGTSRRVSDVSAVGDVSEVFTEEVVEEEEDDDGRGDARPERLRKRSADFLGVSASDHVGADERGGRATVCLTSRRRSGSSHSGPHVKRASHDLLPGNVTDEDHIFEDQSLTDITEDAEDGKPGARRKSREVQ